MDQVTVMNPTLKAKWLKALRGKKYEKCSSALRSGNRYCATGVLCDISGVGEWDGDRYVVGDMRARDFAPVAVRESAGLSVINLMTVEVMNDSGATFAEIADYIERRYQVLTEFWRWVKTGQTTSEAMDAAILARTQDQLREARDNFARTNSVLTDLHSDHMKLRAELAEVRAELQRTQKAYRNSEKECQRLRDWKKTETSLAEQRANDYVSKSHAAMIEVARVKGTLEFYAAESNYDESKETGPSYVIFNPPPAIADRGQRARVALADFLA